MGFEFIDLPSADQYVHDENGDSVVCPICGGDMIFKDDAGYICSECSTTMERTEFFDYIGVEPLGPACATCDSIFPGCDSCPHGYV